MAKQKNTVLGSLDYQSVIELLDLKKVDNKLIVWDFTLTQKGFTPMNFNCDFNGLQKKHNDNLFVSRECILRKIFNNNATQMDFNIPFFIERDIMMRGTVKTTDDKKDKFGNCCLNSCLEVRMECVEYELCSNDKLGTKADDKKENYLETEENYLNTVFVGGLIFDVRRYFHNVMGRDFAQYNALKSLSYNSDEELQSFIDYVIPVENGTLDISCIQSHISKKLNSLYYWDHRHSCARFEMNMNTKILNGQKEYIKWYDNLSSQWGN